MLFYYLFCKKDFTFVLIFVIVYTERERKTLRGAKRRKKGKKMKKIEKFFSFNEDEGKLVLHPVNMGSDSWCLRSADDYFLEFGVDQFLDYGAVLLEDGEHLLQLIELDDSVCFCIHFGVKGRQIIIEDISCRNAYKRHYYSIMPDRGMYIL